ncbi:MAG: amino acid permease [Bacillota bacterium]|nr:amino acid permease [Bacillota bacterium]
MVNLIGIKTVGLTQVISTSVLIGLLVFLTLWSVSSIDKVQYIPFFPFGFRPVFSIAGFIFIYYGGMLTVTGLAEEVKRPRRNIPLGIILGLLITGLVYVAVISVIVGTR